MDKFENKCLVKANKFWHQGELAHALCCYRKALKSSLQTQEKSKALYMCAFLSCAINQEIHDDELLGVDLRDRYEDNYLQAAYYLSQIESGYFSPSELGLPIIDNDSLRQIRKAMVYQHKINQEKFNNWKDSFKRYVRLGPMRLLKRA